MAQTNIKSAVMLFDEINLFKCSPNQDILMEREDNNSYCMTDPGEEIVIYFTGKGKAKINTSEMSDKINVQHLDIYHNKWTNSYETVNIQSMNLSISQEGMYIIVIKSINE